MANPPTNFGDNFNRSDRVLAGDNGWVTFGDDIHPVRKALGIVNGKVRILDPGGDIPEPDWDTEDVYNVPLQRGAAFHPDHIAADGVWRASAVISHIADLANSGFSLVIGGSFDTYAGVALTMFPNGYMFISHYHPTPPSSGYVYFSYAVIGNTMGMNLRQNVGKDVRYTVTYNPVTGVAQAFEDERLVIDCVTDDKNRPWGTYSGFVMGADRDDPGYEVNEFNFTGLTRNLKAGPGLRRTRFARPARA